MRVVLIGGHQLQEFGRQLRERGMQVYTGESVDLRMVEIDEAHMVVVAGGSEDWRVPFLYGYAAGRDKHLVRVAADLGGGAWDLWTAKFDSWSAFLLAIVNGTLPGICRECGCTEELSCLVQCAWTDETRTECTTHVEERKVSKRATKTACTSAAHAPEWTGQSLVCAVCHGPAGTLAVQP